MVAELVAPRTGLIGKPLSNGLILPADLTFDEWRGVVEHVEMVVESSPWWLCDAMAFGEAFFPQQYTQALPTAEEDPHGASQSRMKQAAWMASKYPRNARVPGLSYTHHRVVAELEPEARSTLLREAVAANLSTRELVHRVKDVQEQARAIPAASRPVCAADSVWTPTAADLLPEHRAALEAAALDANLDDPRGFSAGALWAMQYTASEALFRPDRWRD